MTAEQLAKADSDSQSQTGTNQNTQNDANSQTEEKQPQEVPSQPVSPTVTLPTTAGQPAEIVTLHAQPKQQTVAANNQLINLTPTSINGQKKKQLTSKQLYHKLVTMKILHYFFSEAH